MGRVSLSWSLISVVILSVLWKSALANDKCSVGCKGSPSGATFLSGHKYNYAVEGVVSIFLNGADKQETSVKLIGQATVAAIGNCAHVLRVQNLVISGPDGKKYGKPVGLEKPVRFTYQDGHIGAEICAEDGDTRRSLNIKRAIISLLQNGQKSGTEVDIFGACPTDSSSSQEGASLLVHRSRDLGRCGHREHGKHDLITAVYNPTAEIKNTQVLQSTLNVESKVNNGVPEKVSAIEEHLYKPFSVGENGARAKVFTKLTLTGKAAGGDNGKFTQVRPIIFENPHGSKTDQSNYQSALSALKETVKTLQTEASSHSAGNFAQLVRIFRNTNKDDLMKIYSQSKGNNLEKRVFLDALLRTGTGYSVEVAIQLLKGNELGPLEEKLAYLSIGNARHVNDEAIKAAANLLDTPNVPKEVYLGVGALAGTYCRQHNCHTSHAAGIAALSNKFASKLNCKPKTKVQEDVMVAILKGIRNIRHLENNLIDKIVHCANDNTAKARLRVAALEAFHADPCAAKLKKTALDLLKNRQLDSEIRIKAYLAVIECPCGKSANEIKSLLDTEPVHQVGRFITTSLRHIRNSANPERASAKQHYGLISTPNRFNVDDRKYSFYREASYNVDTLGLGGTLEQTVIYSQDSFLPRSAAFNVTAEVFGHNFNVFEVGGRQGNLDLVVEHFLGPKGFLRTNKPQDIYDIIVNKLVETEKKVDGKIRGRRSIKSDIDNFDKHVKAESTPYDNELDMDVYVKLFGTEAIFLSLGDDKGFDYNDLLNQVLKYIDTGMNKAKHFQQEIRAHLLFLDAELAYATSTGLPLKLNLVGAATGRLDVSTNVDIRQIARDPNNAKIDFKLVPSTDIEVSGLFQVDADVLSAGIKVVTNLHSSTGTHVNLKILENGQGFDLQLGLPIDKQEIITATNDLVYFTSEKGQKEKQTPIKTDTDRKDYSFCFDQLSKTVGLTLCGDIVVPFSVSGPEAQASIQKFIQRYPLVGVTKLKLQLEKNDLKGYHVKGLLKREKERTAFELLLEAQGSQVRRSSVSGEFVNSLEEKTVALNLESPFKNIGGQISLYNKPNDITILIKAKQDAEEYFARAGFNAKGNDARRVYTPVMEYQLPDGKGKQSLKIEGQVVSERKGPKEIKYSFDGIKINLPNKEVLDINGKIDLGPETLESDIKAKKGEHNLLLSASYKNDDTKIEFRNTLNPYLNFKINSHNEFEKESSRNDIDLYFMGDLKDPLNRVTFNQLFKYKEEKSPEDYGFITKNKFHIYCVPFSVEFNAECDPKRLDVEVRGEYDKDKANFKLEGRTQMKKPEDYRVKVEANYNDKGVEAFSKREVSSADKSLFENFVMIKNFGKYELSGIILHKDKPNDMNIGVVGHFKVTGSGKNEDLKFDIGTTETKNVYASHAKISRGKTDLIDFLLKSTRGPASSGQLKLVLKDTIAANGQFKYTDNDGKGNGMIIIDFKAAQRKFKGDVKFIAKDPVFNADVDVFLNFEKDNNDKIHFTTNSKCEDDLTDSKNSIEYGGRKMELNVFRDGEFDLDGKLKGSVEVVLPNERLLSVSLDRNFNEDKSGVQGVGEITFTDAVKRGGPASTICYKSKLSNLDFDKDTGSYEGSLNIKLKDGRNLENTFVIKNKQTDNKDKYKFDFKTDVKGSLIPAPASLVAVVDYTDEDDTIDGQEKYRIKATYGDDFSAELVGSEVVHLMEKGDKKYQEDVTATLRLPLEKCHDVKIISSVLYLQPENKDFYVEYTVMESVQINADLYKIDASGKLGPKAGDTKVKVLVPHVDPFSLDANYKSLIEEDKQALGVELKATYGKGKSANIILDANNTPQQKTLSVKAHAPQAEKLKKLEFELIGKNPAPDSYTTILTVDADGRIYKSDVVIVYSKSRPVFDLKYTNPNSPKPSRLYLKGESLGSSQAKADIIIDNIHDLSLTATSEGNIQRDNVALKFVGNSEKLGMKNYKVDISSKDAGNGKRLEFHATNDNKNVFSGSTSFISKQEGQKTIIEGSGSVKVKDEPKSASFKYIRTLLTEGAEQGVETFVNVAIGERSLVAESRITNFEYKNSYVYCEEKKQCAHAEVNSKLNVQKTGQVEQTLNVGLDLRALGLSPEMGLQARSELSQDRLPQHLLDLHINKNDHKYHLHAYSQPRHGKFPAGIVITLPKRVLALESDVTYPTDKAMPFPIKGDVALYMDKNKPQLKAGARFLVDVTGSDKQHTLKTVLGFVHPKMAKESTVEFRSSLQRPSENSIKIESSTVVSCPIIGANNKAEFVFEASPAHVKLLVVSPLVKVIDLDGSVTFKDKLGQADMKFSLLEGKPVQVHFLAKDFQYVEFTTGYSDEAERKLSVVGQIDPEKRVGITADIVLANGKKNIVHGALFLQDNLVKSDYGVSNENFNHFVEALRNDLLTLNKRIADLGNKANTEIKNRLNKLEPNVKQLAEYYEGELKKLTQELTDDQVLKDICAALDEVIRFFASIIDSVVQTTKPIVEQIEKTFIDLNKQVSQIYNEKIEKQVKQFYDSISALVQETVDSIVDVITHSMAIAIDFFEKHKPELKELTDTIAEIFKDITRLVVAQMKELSVMIRDFINELTHEIKEMPFITVIREKIQEMAVPERLSNFLAEALSQISPLLPTDELRAFVDALAKYTEKKLHDVKCDDSKEMRVLYEKFAVAVSSVVQLLRQQMAQFGVPQLLSFNFVPLFSNPGQGLPSLGNPPSFSILNQILHGDLPDPISLIKAYRPRHVNPLDEVPSKLRAVVVNGQHIFTFDGRHMTFPGTCRYILAHDHVDRNFTVVLQLNNGKPKAILIEDKTGSTVEIKDNGQVALNGAAHGFPVNGEIFAFRQAAGLVGLGSEYGVIVMCTPDLSVCQISVSGFYLGKLRGLLGDGNNEPYDDFRLPNGKVATSEAEFGNAYRLSGSCAAVTTPDHSHHHFSQLPAACETVFGADSTLRPLSLFLDIAPFRQACVHAVEKNSEHALKEACDLGKGYLSLAYTGLLPGILPSDCVRCTDVDKPKEVGDTYDFDVPEKQADIVVAVELTKPTEHCFKELAVPLVNQVINGLKAEKITDVKVFLVGLTPKMPYAVLYDTDNKLKNAKMVFDAKTRDDDDIPSFASGVIQLDNYMATLANVANEIRHELGVTNIDMGYRNLRDLPTRPKAIKHTIYVVGEAIEESLGPLQFLSALVTAIEMENRAMTSSLITVTPEMKIGGGKSAENVVAFGEDVVYMLGDKKPNKESSTLRDTIENEDNFAVEYVETIDGLVVSSSNFHALKAPQQAQFLQTASSAMLNLMLGSKYEQECLCMYVSPFHARTVCFNEDKNEAVRRRK